LLGRSWATLEVMKPTMDHHNGVLAHKPIEGLRFEHNDYVQIVAGEHNGKNGSLVSVEELGEDPLFVLEMESDFDIRVRQSQLERADF